MRYESCDYYDFKENAALLQEIFFLILYVHSLKNKNWQRKKMYVETKRKAESLTSVAR